MVEIKQHWRGPFNDTQYWDIFREGKFIIGSQSEREAHARLEGLQQNNWTHLDCYCRGYADPIKFIEHVREEGWTFDLSMTGIEFLNDGRMFFHGNVNEYSNAYRYLVLDKPLIRKIIKLVPEAKVTGQQTSDIDAAVSA